MIASVSWFELLIPVLIIALYHKHLPSLSLKKKTFSRSFQFFLRYLAFPITTGLLLYHYAQFYFIEWNFNGTLFLRFIHFILSFLALQLFLDGTESRKVRWIGGFIIILILGFLQDFSLTFSPLSKFFAIIGSSGFFLAISIPTLRKIYQRDPVSTLLFVIWIAFVSVFIPFGMRSDNFITFFLLWMITILGLHSVRYTLRTSLITFASAMLFIAAINFILPGMVKEKYNMNFLEDALYKTKYTKTFSGIRFHYNHPEMESLCKKWGKVLQAAYHVSKEHLGVAPQVTDFYLLGYDRGGFHAVFPGTIAGYILSPAFAKIVQDSSFLNNPDYNIHFPDPVISILHEYSHLYGIVPYNPWFMGAEEEGWATFSAVTLAKYLYKEFGDSLWDPPYPYHLLAEKSIE